jgi:hypothetical protein
MQIASREVPEPTANPVPNDRGPDSATHDKANPGRLVGVVADKEVTNHKRAADAASPADRRAELLTTAHPGSCGQHRHSPPR